jgi:catechol 2,3-dioxygenase
MGVMGLDLGWWIRWNGGMTTDAVPARTRIGHVHLKVADLERALGFYHGVLGFEVTQRYGSGAVFLSAGG